jgi:hypothetical protein
MGFGSDNNYLKKGQSCCRLIRNLWNLKGLKVEDQSCSYFLDKELIEMDKMHIDKMTVMRI